MDDRVPDRTDTHASSSHEVSLEPTPTRREDLGKHSVESHSPKDRKLRNLSEDQIYKGTRAEDALAEPYLVLKILVI